MIRFLAYCLGTCWRCHRSPWPWWDLEGLCFKCHRERLFIRMSIR